MGILAATTCLAGEFINGRYIVSVDVSAQNHVWLQITQLYSSGRASLFGLSIGSHANIFFHLPKPVGWMMCFLLMTFVPVQKLCVNKYVYIYIYALLYESCFLWFTNCVSLSDNSLIPGCLWLLVFVLNNTRYFVFYNPSPGRMFLSLDLLSEYRIQHGAIGPPYVTSSYSTWIFCRGVSGFATDCPCDVWCRELNHWLLHVGPPFGNRFLNTT